MSATTEKCRFTILFGALMIMPASHPFFRDDATGAALGGLTSLLILGGDGGAP